MMKKHYSICFPYTAGLPIIMIDYYTDKSRRITLTEAKDAVFKAVLQDHHFMIEKNPSPMIAEAIHIVDNEEFERSREAWIASNADLNLRDAMDRDAGK